MTELPLALMVLLARLQVELPRREALRFDWGASLRRMGGQQPVLRAA